MCPSFRVTRDEAHLTRGRANTLRLALSGQLGHASAAEALASDEVAAAMDLCVGCKGCKRECPTGVDMARMKIEFLHQRQRRDGLSIMDRLVAYLPRYAPWAARVPWVANARDALPGAARLGERLFGLTSKRTLPRWRRDTFLRDAVSDPGAADVVLFADTFSNYHEPDNARAALAVLRAAGYRVHVARPAATDPAGQRPLCCGRTFLAAGLVEEAKHEAGRLLAALVPYAQAGTPIVGLEPSCLLGLRDELQVLGLGDPAARVARSALLIEEFLAREHDAGRLKLTLRSISARRALLHGHCHQKAFDAMAATQRVLRLVPGLEVETVESSCCGMAGSFGFEAAHYDVSMRMAELSLLPAVRAADAGTLIVADGTSCRQQIADGTRAAGAREAMHVVRVLAAALPAGR
jgi:Fe-S oxidoreductase